MASHSHCQRTPSRGTASALACVILSLLLSACSTIFTMSQAPGDSPPVDPPRHEAAPYAQAPRVALVLSGGAARALALIGVLRVLEREGLRPDLVVGTSAGAMVGAYYAAGRPVAEIEALAAQLDLPTLIDIDRRITHTQESIKKPTLRRSCIFFNFFSTSPSECRLKTSVIIFIFSSSFRCTHFIILIY